MYNSHPGGDTMLVLNIDDLTKVKLSLNCTPTETNPSPTRPLCDVVSLHRDSRKMRTIPNSSRRLSQQDNQPNHHTQKNKTALVKPSLSLL